MIINLEASPFSINSAYYLKGNGKVRTAECRQWGDAVLGQLQSYRDEMRQFTAEYDRSKEAVTVNILFKIPTNKYYTYEKTISSRSTDLTNVEKLLVDLIFDARFFGRTVNGQKIINLNINDKDIVDLVSSKRPSYKYNIQIIIDKILLPVSEEDPQYATEEASGA